MFVKGLFFRSLSKFSSLFVDVTQKLHKFSHYLDHEICDLSLFAYEDQVFDAINKSESKSFDPFDRVDTVSPLQDKVDLSTKDMLMNCLLENKEKNDKIINCPSCLDGRQIGAIKVECVTSFMKDNELLARFVLSRADGELLVEEPEDWRSIAAGSEPASEN